jgi:thioredoxin reductase (NADPH)
MEPEAMGGQAGTSSMIRNYLGFPAGVSGADLALRAYTQAWTFGAEYVYSSASGLRPEGSELVVTAADGSEVRSRAVVVATGMTYRRLGIPKLDALTGAGVFCGAAASGNSHDGPRCVRGRWRQLGRAGCCAPRQVRRASHRPRARSL